MKGLLQDRLYRREIGLNKRDIAIEGLYADRSWIDRLDIVDELGGHGGCVNALTWSKSGQLLASGSDDTNLNIHSYQPESSTSRFLHTTTIYTGHRANIFSVKFMPHSNDRTLVSCAGDSEVRVFDIEYQGHAVTASHASEAANAAASSTAAARRSHYLRHLTDGTTNARVYRSHGDRAKRLVTESSPYLFLSCSEDGEVRQWDLRQPSTFYPPPSGTRYNSKRLARDNSNVPPPLISYKRYNIDLNTLSCSASQPHYIALGGAHLHLFLHDRRMLGRDVGSERGSPGSASGMESGQADAQMDQATHCVRRFAPRGQSKMRRHDDGHITACKISDANPNEVIASWSGDHIYSFDLVYPSDEPETRSALQGNDNGKVRDPKPRKRKRTHGWPSSSAGFEYRGSRVNRSITPPTAEDSLFQVRLGNGHVEDFTRHNGEHADSSDEMVSESHLRLLRSRRVAKRLLKIRKGLFSLDEALRTDVPNETEKVNHFANIAISAAKCLSQMDQIIRTWKYPVAPSMHELRFQHILRQNRDKSRRFLQAVAAVSNALASNHPADLHEEANHDPFRDPQLIPTSLEGPSPPEPAQVFCLDFIKAILLWIKGDWKAVLHGFQRPREGATRNPARYPIKQETVDFSGIHDELIPYLLTLAGGRPVINTDASRFERDDTRHIFRDESAAVIAFSHAVKIPLGDLPAAVVTTGSDSETPNSAYASQHRSTVARFWIFKVCRSLLLNAGEGVNYSFVETCFGGLHSQPRIVDEERSKVGVDAESDTTMQNASDGTEVTGVITDELTTPNFPSSQPTEDNAISEVAHDPEESTREDSESLSRDNYEGDDAETDSNEDGEGNATGNDSDSPNAFYESASRWGSLRDIVEAGVPVSAAKRSYRGHCNVKTVKDVNFFGLQDEYVISGSDCGNLFIWDRKSGELVNILKGDGEVVNVVQGHPYEPMIAASGIDATIKIFAPDQRAQRDARFGRHLSKNEGRQNHNYNRDFRRQTYDAHSSGINSSLQDGATEEEDNSEIEERSWAEAGPNNPVTPLTGGLQSCKRFHNMYNITSQNDLERRGGNRDAFTTVYAPDL
ncbi:hypothetical protein MMC25_004831 [Agyrium rufum]|nr:hypothetical protein [Agyrium rufum]